MSNRLGRGYSYEINRCKDVVLQSLQGWQWYSSRTRCKVEYVTAHSDIVEVGKKKVESWINAREGASENPTNVGFSRGVVKSRKIQPEAAVRLRIKVRMDEFQPLECK